MKISIFQAILFLTSLVTADLVGETSSVTADLVSDEGIDGNVEKELEAETASHVRRGNQQLLSHKSKSYSSKSSYSKSYSSTKKSYSSYKSKSDSSYKSYSSSKKSKSYNSYYY